MTVSSPSHRSPARSWQHQQQQHHNSSKMHHLLLAPQQRKNLYIGAVCAFLLLGASLQAAYLLVARSTGRQRPGPAEDARLLRASPVFHILARATATVADRSAHLPDLSSSSSNSAPASSSQLQLQLQPECQVQEVQLQRVLAAAATPFSVASATATTAAADGTMPLSGQAARQAALELRARLKTEWKAVLAPYAAAAAAAAAAASQGLSNNSSASSSIPNCKSVGLAENQLLPSPPPSAAAASSTTGSSTSKPRTALLLVMGSWTSLDHLLSLYSINLFTIWSYARLYNYGLELYVHEEPLPVGLPIYFIKVSGVRYLFDTLGYQNALYLDFDAFTSPHSAPPLSLFFGEFPAASLLMQAEHNVCAAAMLWRNTPDADTLLQAWWDVGAAGCCPTFPHDQTALKHMLLAYIANITGEAWLYGPDMQARFKLPPSGAVPKPWKRGKEDERDVLSTDHMPHKVGTWVDLRPRMQQRHSAVGWVGLDAHFPATPGASYSRVVLHNCLGFWWGCVPFNTPSLLYHTGHWAMEELEDTWLAERLLHSTRDWLSTLDTPHQQQPTATAPH